MLASPLDYSQLVERALRRVVQDALTVVAERGLPGRHHFYITFRTDHPDVMLDDGLRARYPSEMTVILQHEFWGLEVGEDRFGVTLSFGGQSHRLEIPFEAVQVFADPSVEFGLQFTVGARADGGEAPATAQAPVAELPSMADKAPGEALVEPEAGPSQEVGGAEVVTLDRFRKK